MIYKILTAGDCFIIVSNLFVSIVIAANKMVPCFWALQSSCWLIQCLKTILRCFRINRGGVLVSGSEALE